LIDPVSLQTLMDGFVRAGETLSANAGRREIPGIPLQVQPPQITRAAAGRRVDERLRSWGENIKQQVSRGKSAKKNPSSSKSASKNATDSNSAQKSASQVEDPAYENDEAQESRAHNTTHSCRGKSVRVIKQSSQLAATKGSKQSKSAMEVGKGIVAI